MSTECKDCKFREGDCGNHFISMCNGSTNYDIASLSACDKYGNCMFFERMAESKGDLISREALKKSFEDTVCIEPMPYAFVKQIIDNAPTVEYTFEEAFQKTVCENKLYCPSRPHGKWLIEGGTTFHFCCSECGCAGDNWDKFCKHCGAKMDGGEEES